MPSKLVATLLACLPVLTGAAAAQTLQPTRYGDFDHYTFALTWQPGFCGTASGCLSDQPHAPLIGLHGLWASRPQVLIARGVSDPTWWRSGCDLLHHSDAQPVLPDALRQQLAAVVPHLASDLLHHEYDKHVQCFGFDPATFFATALALHDRIADGSFAQDLAGRAGTTVQHADLITAFEADLHTAAPRALQLQCEPDPTGRSVLTQLWITLPTGGIDQFPAPATLINSPTVQDNCPASFLVPNWSTTG